MINEEKTKQQLIEKFSYLKDSIAIKRERRIFADVPLEHLPQVLDYLVKGMQFTMLFSITGLDEVSNLAVIYHLSNDGRIILNLKTRLPRDNPSLQSVTPYFINADIYERELMDLLGIQVVGLKPGHRYPLSDNFPRNEFPLRKDWKKKEAKK